MDSSDPKTPTYWGLVFFFFLIFSTSTELFYIVVSHPTNLIYLYAFNFSATAIKKNSFNNNNKFAQSV